MIKLDENYTIDSDSMQWVLRYKKVTTQVVDGNQKEVKTEWQTYHGQLKYALNKYVNEVPKTADSVKELLQAVLALDAKVEAVKVYFDKRKNHVPESEDLDLTVDIDDLL